MGQPPCLDAPYIIEFFGLPGCGKTSVAKDLIRALRDKGEDVRDCAQVTRDGLPKARRSFARLGLIVRESPRTMPLLPMLSGQLLGKQRTLTDRIKAAFVCATVSSLAARLGRLGQNAVMDQGPAQAAWSTLLEARNPGATERLHARMRGMAAGHSWHVVILDAPDDVIRQRLARRPSKHSRLQSPDHIEDSPIWRRARSAFDQISAELETASRQGEIRLTRLSSEMSTPGDVAGTILKIAFAG